MLLGVGVAYLNCRITKGGCYFVKAESPGSCSALGTSSKRW